MIRSMVVSFLRSEELDTRSSDNKNASTAQQFMSGGSGFLPFLSLNNRQHLSQFTPSLLDHLTPWPFAANLGTWDPPEHCQKILFGSNTHLRQNIKIYLRLNSTVCL